MEVVEVLQQLYGLVSDDILYALLSLSVQNDLVDNLLDIFGVFRQVLAHLLEGFFEFIEPLEAWKAMAVKYRLSLEIFEEILAYFGAGADHAFFDHEVGLVLRL